MEQPTGESRDLARQVLVFEAGESKLERLPPAELAEVGQRICLNLYGQMSQLIGPAGFYALGTRALHLAQIEFPILDGVQLDTQGEACLQGLHEKFAGKNSSEIISGLVAVFGNFLWLLISLIGPDLTLRQVHSVWPEIPLYRGESGGKGVAE